MSNRAWWSCLAVAFFVTGCAADPAVRAWWTIREADFLQFKPGQTTKAEIRTRLGRPLTESHFARRSEEVWEYRFLESGTIHMVASFYFDGRGVFNYYTAEPDPSVYNTLW